MTIVIKNPYAKKPAPSKSNGGGSSSFGGSTVTLKLAIPANEKQATGDNKKQTTSVTKAQQKSESEAPTVPDLFPRRIPPHHQLRADTLGPQSPRGKIFKRRKEEEDSNHRVIPAATPHKKRCHSNPSLTNLPTVAEISSSSEVESDNPREVANTTASTKLPSKKSTPKQPKGIFKRKSSQVITDTTNDARDKFKTVDAEDTTSTTATSVKKAQRRGVTFEPNTTKPPSTSSTTKNSSSAQSLNDTSSSSSSSSAASKKPAGGSSKPHRSLFKSKLKSKYKQEIAALKKQRRKQQEYLRRTTTQAQQRQEQQQKQHQEKQKQIQEEKQNKVLQILEQQDTEVTQDQECSRTNSDTQGRETSGAVTSVCIAATVSSSADTDQENESSRESSSKARSSSSAHISLHDALTSKFQTSRKRNNYHDQDFSCEKNHNDGHNLDMNSHEDYDDDDDDDITVQTSSTYRPGPSSSSKLSSSPNRRRMEMLRYCKSWEEGAKTFTATLSPSRTNASKTSSSPSRSRRRSEMIRYCKSWEDGAKTFSASSSADTSKLRSPIRCYSQGASQHHKNKETDQEVSFDDKNNEMEAHQRNRHHDSPGLKTIVSSSPTLHKSNSDCGETVAPLPSLTSSQIFRERSPKKNTKEEDLEKRGRLQDKRRSASSPSPSPPTIVLHKSPTQSHDYDQSYQYSHPAPYHYQQQQYQGYPSPHPTPSCYPSSAMQSWAPAMTSPSHVRPQVTPAQPPHPAASSSSFWGILPSSSSSSMGPPHSTQYGYDAYYYHHHHPSKHQHQQILQQHSGSFGGHPADSPTSSAHGGRPYGTPGGSTAALYYSPAQHHPMMLYPQGPPGAAPAPYPNHTPYPYPSMSYPPEAGNVPPGGHSPYPPPPPSLLAVGSVDDDDSVVELSYHGVSSRHGPNYQTMHVASATTPQGYPHPYASSSSHPHQQFWRGPVPSWGSSSHRHNGHYHHPHEQHGPNNDVCTTRASPTLSPRYHHYYSNDSVHNPENHGREPPHHQQRHYSKLLRLPPPLPFFPQRSSKQGSSFNENKNSSIPENKNGTSSSTGKQLVKKKSTGSTSGGPVNAVVKVMANVLEPPCPLANDYEKLQTAIGLLKPKKGTTSFGISIQVHVTSTLVDPTVSTALSSTTTKTQSNSDKESSCKTSIVISNSKVDTTKSNEEVSTSIEQKTSEAQAKAKPVENNVTQADTNKPTSGRRRRRRRHFFAALTILDASIQNERLKNQAAKANNETKKIGSDNSSQPSLVLLEPGDVILSIAGKRTAGLNFAECCKLFQRYSQEETEMQDEKKEGNADSTNDPSDSEKKMKTSDVEMKDMVKQDREKGETPKETNETEDGMICVPIEIARRKKPAPAPDRPVSESSGKQEQQMLVKSPRVTITEFHLAALANVILNCLLELNDRRGDCGRVLGRADSLDAILQPKLAVTIPELVGSAAIAELLTLWQKHSKTRMRKAHQSAIKHWQDAWANEPQAIQAWHPNPLSDRQRAILRFAPRPNAGCRCSSKEHTYVNHPDCPLYSNLRRLKNYSDENELSDNDGEKSPDSKDVSKKTASTNSNQKEPLSALNRVGTALVDRVKRQRSEQDDLDKEARFVAQMEQLQLESCKQAIFAPSLAAMVISAVTDLNEEDKTKNATDTQMKPEKDETATKMEDDDDNDDIPLADLVKKGSGESPTKKQKRATLLSPYYMARLARHISWTWGHVAQEPSHLDHAWRWEVFHGQHNNSNTSSPSDASNSSAVWDAKEAHNPRRPGAYSLEHVRWLLDDKSVMVHLREVDLDKSLKDKNPDHLFALQCLAQVLDPRRGTGLMEEVTALVHSQVLEVSKEDGSLKLAEHWYLNVDVLLLEQMDAWWGKDPLRYQMNAGVVSKLGQEWIKTKGNKENDVDDDDEEGEISEAAWVSRWAPEEPIYEMEEFVTWRQAFEQREEIQSNELHGIGQFGV